MTIGQRTGYVTQFSRESLGLVADLGTIDRVGFVADMTVKDMLGFVADRTAAFARDVGASPQ